MHFPVTSVKYYDSINMPVKIIKAPTRGVLIPTDKADDTSGEPIPLMFAVQEKMMASYLLIYEANTRI